MNKNYAKAIDAKLRSLKKAETKNSFTLGALLEEVAEKKLHTYLGFANRRSYIEAIGFSTASDHKLRRLHRVFGTRADISDLYELGTTRLDHLANAHLEPAELNAWLKVASDYSCTELRARLLKSTGASRNPRAFQQNFTFTRAEHKRVTKTVQKVIDLGYADTYGEALDVLVKFWNDYDHEADVKVA